MTIPTPVTAAWQQVSAITTEAGMDSLPHNAIVAEFHDDGDASIYRRIHGCETGWEAMGDGEGPYSTSTIWRTGRTFCVLFRPDIGPATAPPGPCMSRSPSLGSEQGVLCELRAGHAGGHENGGTSWLMFGEWPAPSDATAAKAWQEGFDAATMTTTRRDAHSGSIYQRASDGMWVVAVELPERDGKRRRKVIVRAKKADAVTALRAARKDLPELTVAGAIEFVRRETGATSVTLGFERSGESD